MSSVITKSSKKRTRDKKMKKLCVQLPNEEGDMYII